MDKIILNNMRFRSFSGVLESEKKEGQLFVVTLTLEIPFIKGCRTDDLHDTVDYSRVFSMVKALIEENSFDLIEYMAEKVIALVLRNFSDVEAVTAEISKPTAPIDGDFDDMRVIIRRTREQMEEVL